MKETLEKLWNEYLNDKCAQISTDEERELAKKAVHLHEKANSLLDAEQKQAVEKYVESLYGIESEFAKKAFLKGCEFSISFLLESMNLNK